MPTRWIDRVKGYIATGYTILLSTPWASAAFCATCPEDSIFGSNRAVMNAQNWALFSSQLFSQLGYPELDFTGVVIATRVKLLHHNSTFALLRSSTAAYRSIRDLPGYDITKDNFRNTFGIDAVPPQTVIELINMILRNPGIMSQV